MSARWPGGPGGTAGMLSIADLRGEAEAGSIDTVVTAFTDMQGRLVGKRIDVSFFLGEVADHGQGAGRQPPPALDRSDREQAQHPTARSQRDRRHRPDPELAPRGAPTWPRARKGRFQSPARASRPTS